MVDNTRTLKVFISSTFIDMQEERDYLNWHVFPKLRKKCAQRGVNFYAVDLRWGVTEEETKLNRTIDVCLKQVKESIPYFIGLIGNRYGWVPEQGGLVEKYPWISQKRTMSATEMEIRYYLQQAKDEKNCSFFAVKAAELCDPAFDDGNQDEIKQLISLVSKDTGKQPFVYQTIESLGEAIFENISLLLEERFPEGEDTLSHEIDTYIGQVEHYDKSEELEMLEKENFDKRGNPFAFARRDPAAFEVMERALLRYKHVVYIEPFGSENICNRYLYHGMNDIGYSNPNIARLCIMLAASEKLQTPTSILEQIHAFLLEYVSNPSEYPLPKTSGVTRLCDMTELLINMQNHLQPEREIIVCISNLHLLKEKSPWYYLSFVVALMCPKIRMVLTTADKAQGQILSELGVPVRNFPLVLQSVEKAGFFAAFVRSLELEGKHLEREVSRDFLELSIFDDTEKALFISNYLKNYVIFDNLSETTDKILAYVKEGKSVYSAVLMIREQELLSEEQFSGEEKQKILSIAASVLEFLDYFNKSEELIYRCFTESGNISKILYLIAFELIRPFLKMRGSGIGVFNKACTKESLEPLAYCENYVATGMVDMILSELDETWQCLDDNYALIRYLSETHQTEELIKLVTNNKWLNYVLHNDTHLLRAAWRGLERHGMLNVSEIYEKSGHINSSYTMRGGKLIYDLLMKMEYSVTGGDSIECFLDFPFSYSLDIERNFKKNWGIEEYNAVKTLRREADTVTSEWLRKYPDSYAEEHAVDASVMASMWEIVCNALSKQDELKESDIANYLFYACITGCLRQIADALSYSKIQEKSFFILFG